VALYSLAPLALPPKYAGDAAQNRGKNKGCKNKEGSHWLPSFTSVAKQ
jgi:hypothetical protein